jgi:YidC/Oxa1 family membrane protein insertase
MDSSKSTTIGFILIFVVFVGWLVYMNGQQAKLPKQTPPATRDTAQAANPPAPDSSAKADSSKQNRSQVFASDTTKAAIPAVEKTIQTPFFIAKVSSNGAAISSFQLREYNTWDKKPVQLVNPENPQGADIDLKFVASDGKTVATNDLPFVLDPKPLILGADDSMSFSAIYRLDTGRTIEKVFHFSGHGYLIGIEYKLRGLENTISGYHYTASLDNPLPFVEQHSAGESSNGQRHGRPDCNESRRGGTQTIQRRRQLCRNANAVFRAGDDSARRESYRRGYFRRRSASA